MAHQLAQPLGACATTMLNAPNATSTAISGAVATATVTANAAVIADFALIVVVGMKVPPTAHRL